MSPASLHSLFHRRIAIAQSYYEIWGEVTLGIKGIAIKASLATRYMFSISLLVNSLVKENRSKLPCFSDSSSLTFDLTLFFAVVYLIMAYDEDSDGVDSSVSRSLSAAEHLKYFPLFRHPLHFQQAQVE